MFRWQFLGMLKPTQNWRDGAARWPAALSTATFLCLNSTGLDPVCYLCTNAHSLGERGPILYQSHLLQPSAAPSVSFRWNPIRFWTWCQSYLCRSALRPAWGLLLLAPPSEPVPQESQTKQQAESCLHCELWIHVNQHQMLTSLTHNTVGDVHKVIFWKERLGSGKCASGCVVIGVLVVNEYTGFSCGKVREWFKGLIWIFLTLTPIDGIIGHREHRVQ